MPRGKKAIYDKWKESGELSGILVLVKKWRRDGAKMTEIAAKLDINPNTLYELQKNHTDFSEALKKGKEIVDTEVEDSLIKECIGYEYEETYTTTTAVVDKETGQITSLEKIETKKIKKYARPSVSAIAYYLNNRLPAYWKNKVIFDADNDNGILPKLLEAMNNNVNSVGNSDSKQSE